MNVHAVFDARGPDPTGTSGIRRGFRAAGKLRLRMFRSQMRQAVIDHDVLGLGGGGLSMQPPETRLRAFQGWARTAADQALGGPWLSQWIARCWASGEAVGATQTASEAPGEGSGAWEELARIELESIAAAAVQALLREAAVALTKRRANKTVTWHRMGRAFDKVAPRRIMALANTFTVACHNRGRLAAYRAAGITKVGVVAERLLPKQSLLLPGGLGDSAHDAKHKGYRGRRPARPEYTLGEVEEPIEVGVRTAGDEFVCIECDAFAANSPHDIDEVEDTLPIHPNCRCTWFPWDDRRFSRDAKKKTERELLLEKLGRKRHRLLASMVPRTFKNRYLPEDGFGDDFNPSQPRDPEGKWVGTGGGGSSGTERHPGKGYSAGARVRDGVIYTMSVEDAQLALSQNRRVDLHQLKSVSTLIKKLGQKAREMEELGQAAPVYNLCNVSVEGSNVFCEGNKGIPRVEMPVIPAKRTKEFIQYLKQRGYDVEKGREEARNLRATQNEIDGKKVALSMKRIKDEGFYKRLVVSQDDYIIDGHHTWAGQLGIDAKDGDLEDDDRSVKVARVNIPIMKLVEEAERFTGGAGKKAAGQDSWDPNQPREPAGTPTGGQFASITGGGISGGATGGPAAFAKKALGEHKHFQASSSAAHHKLVVQQVTKAPALRNHTYRWKMNKYIDEAKAFGATENIPALQAKIGESLWREAAHKQEAGKLDASKAKAMFAKAKALGYGVPPPAPKPGTTAHVEQTVATLMEPSETTGTISVEELEAPGPDDDDDDFEEVAAAQAAHAAGMATIPVAKVAWTKIGPQKGSVAGGLYGDPQGNTWYVKTPKSDAHVNADLLANNLYKLAGVGVSNEVKTVLEGKPAVASQIITGQTMSAAPADLEQKAREQLRENFAVDAWLGNRDVIGQGFDNVLVTSAGTPIRLDQGGALMYRAQGEVKNFGPVPDEITSMRSSQINPQTASVFGSMTDAQVAASIDKVLAIPDSSIKLMAKQHGVPGVAETLILRKQWLADYQKTLNVPGSTFGVVKPAPAAQPKPTAAELEKAKKAGPYYPAPQTMMGQAAVKAFNEKWGTKVPEAHELEEKVAEYKATKAVLEGIQQQEMSAAEKVAAATKKQQAAATKAAKAAMEAKAAVAAEAHKAEIAKIAADIGLNPDDAEQVDTLIQLAGGNHEKIVQQFKAFHESGKGKHGLPITPFESAMIQSYVGSAYGSANRQLREGAWDMKTHVFAAAIQKALAKLPAYNEVVKRGFGAKTTEQQQYVVGKIVHWNAFSSCGKSSNFGGNMQCTITPLSGNATRARDLGPMNPTEAGGEVLYMAKSSFKVTSVTGSPGGTMHVHLQEVESF